MAALGRAVRHGLRVSQANAPRQLPFHQRNWVGFSSISSQQKRHFFPFSRQPETEVQEQEEDIIDAEVLEEEEVVEVLDAPESEEGVREERGSGRHKRKKKSARALEHRRALRPTKDGVPFDEGGKRQFASAKHFAIEYSPKKLNFLVKHIGVPLRGMNTKEAITQLQLTRKSKAWIVWKCIQNAHNTAVTYGMDPSKLVISEVWVGKGEIRKGIRMHGRGRFGIKHKRYSNLRISVTEGPLPKSEEPCGVSFAPNALDKKRHAPYHGPDFVHDHNEPIQLPREVELKNFLYLGPLHPLAKDEKGHYLRDEQDNWGPEELIPEWRKSLPVSDKPADPNTPVFD